MLRLRLVKKKPAEAGSNSADGRPALRKEEAPKRPDESHDTDEREKAARDLVVARRLENRVDEGRDHARLFSASLDAKMIPQARLDRQCP